MAKVPATLPSDFQRRIAFAPSRAAKKTKSVPLVAPVAATPVAGGLIAEANVDQHRRLAAADRRQDRADIRPKGRLAQLAVAGIRAQAMPAPSTLPSNDMVPPTSPPNSTPPGA